MSSALGRLKSLTDRLRSRKPRARDDDPTFGEHRDRQRLFYEQIVSCNNYIMLTLYGMKLASHHFQFAFDSESPRGDDHCPAVLDVF